MITREEIKDLLKENRHLDIIKAYNDNLSVNNELNNAILKKVITYLSNIFNIDFFTKYPNTELFDTFFYTLNYLKKVLNEDEFLELINTITSFGYNDKSELTNILILIDQYLTGNFNKNKTISLVNTLTTVKDVYIKRNTIDIDTIYGKTHILNAHELLNINPIKPRVRYHHCHMLTSEVLNHFPNLYGAYYHIPHEFKGFYDHSVIIDFNKDTVYDLTMDAALSYTLFKNFYPKEEFIISGYEFNELDEFVKNNFNFALTTDILDSLIRIKKRKD